MGNEAQYKAAARRNLTYRRVKSKTKVLASRIMRRMLARDLSKDV